VSKRWVVGSSLAGTLLLATCALALTGCSNIGYYLQSAGGHLRVMNAARPVRDVINDDASPERLRKQLELSQRIREFASRELQLPDNPSYRRYADLHRSAVIWNVVAAPPDSLKLKTWCFPITGCITYRGYFDEEEARAEAARLAAEGMESAAYPVPAYSTLGWMNWAGGDPLLNTFIHYPEGELARLLFHELAHQLVYAKDDSMFNESFATAVERLGVRRWLETQASDKARADYAVYNGRRLQFRALTQSTRRELQALYETHPDPVGREKRKQEILAHFRAGYRQLRDGWNLDPNRLRLTDRWVAEANNATFGAQATYDELVPGFEALFASLGGDWTRFYDEVRRLAKVPKAERHLFLKDKENAHA
jgi:predicted aminopeptidase